VNPPAVPVLGWRIWRLLDGSLHSLVIDYRWEPGENVAACMRSGHTACAASPGRQCNCGFWAASSPREALSRTCATIEPPWQVLGTVAMSGAVVAHGADGLRAERANLRCLFTDRPWSWTPPAGTMAGRSDWDALKSVAHDYGVPLLSLSNAESLGFTAALGDHNLLSTPAERPVAGGTGRTAR
jgi:hypothetical protein